MLRTKLWGHRLVSISLLAVASVVLISCGPESEGPGSQDLIVRHLSIFEAPDEYCAWPDAARTTDGDIIILYCKSEEHLGPNGAILLSRSTDNGQTWLDPDMMYDTPIDDRESGVTILSDGRLLGHFISTFHTSAKYDALRPLAYEKDVLEQWKRREFQRRMECHFNGWRENLVEAGTREGFHSWRD
jgi:hypothetical protein